MRTRNASPLIMTHLNSLILVGVFIILAAAVMIVPVYSVRSDSSPATGARQGSKLATTSAKASGVGPFATWNSTAPAPWLSPLALPLPAPQSGLTITTYAGDCSTPKTVFNLQDTDLTVCAKITGADPDWRIIWSNAQFVAVQNVALGTGENSFTLTGGSSLGDWRVIAFEPFGGSVYAVTPFTVVDAANPSADLTISKFAVTNPVAAGSQAVFGVQVTNLGPSDAATVQITDSVPANTTFASFALVSGPAGFNCILPTVGSTGDVICTVSNMARGETASFVAAYDVIAGVSSGTVISNTASVSSIADLPTPATPDPNTANNTSMAEAVVQGATAETCTLDCPANVVVTANTTSGGQPGAFVNFGAASVSGNCGAVSNNPQSGSFFAVGAHSIVSTSEAGPSCSFTVTVLDTNPPTITCPPNITATAPTGATEYTLPSGPGTPTINASGGGTVTGVRSDDTPATYDQNGNVVTPAVVHLLTDPYPIGTTGILWTVTDAGGRTASCTQTITIVDAGDRDPVTISCPANVTVSAPGGTCAATISAATIGTPTTNPSDSNVVVVSQRSDNLLLTDPFPAGATTITWTATDNLNGNVASCVQTVTVTVPNSGDTTPPTLAVPPNVTTTTASCTATLDDELGVATATDTGTCNGSVTITRTGVPANFVFPTGTTTIIYTATDAAGNVATGLQLVTVTESPAVPPTVNAPASILTGLNTGGVGGASCGTVVADATLGTASANDNCPGVTVARTGVPAGNNFPVGDTIITYTATDRSGNTAQAFQTVRVFDNTPPVITSVPAGGQTDAGSCSATIPDVVTGTVASDNCAILSTIQSPLAGTAVGLGTHTITVTVTDVNGNSSQAQTTFTVNALQYTGNFWLGLKNSDDVGTKFDLLAEVFRNGAPVGSSQINDLPSGSSGFNNAILRTLGGTISSVGFCTGDVLSVKLSVRVATSSPPGHSSGTIRLWYNDSAANSRFGKIVNGVTTTDYLRKISNNLVLDPSTGPLPKLTIDVLINKNQNGNAFKPFGTWTKTF